MEIVSKQTRLDSLYVRWCKNYPPDVMDGEWAPISKILREDPPKTCEEAAQIIGNDSWTRISCYQCDEEKDIVVRVGEEPDYDSATSWICKDCLLTALKMIEDYEKTN